MRLPFVSRRRHEADLAALTAYHAEQLAGVTIVNDRLTEDRTDLRVRHERAVRAVARLLPALWQARDEVRSLTDLAVQANKALDRAEERVRAARAEGRREARVVTAEEREKQSLDGAPLVRREPPAGALRQAEERCRLLDQRVTELQQSHVADTRELHDLRQKGALS